MDAARGVRPRPAASPSRTPRSSVWPGSARSFGLRPGPHVGLRLALCCSVFPSLSLPISPASALLPAPCLKP